MPHYATHPNVLYRSSFIKVTNSVFQTPWLLHSTEISTSANKYFRTPCCHFPSKIKAGNFLFLWNPLYLPNFRAWPLMSQLTSLPKFFFICFIEGLPEVIIILVWLYWISPLQHEQPFCNASYYIPTSNFFNWQKWTEIDLFSLQRTFSTPNDLICFLTEKLILPADQSSLIR